MKLGFHRICLAAAAATGLLISACGGSATHPSTAPRTGTAARSPAVAGPAANPPSQGIPPPPGPLRDGYLPLFPFASRAEVRAWQAEYRSGGHQPWHLSADMTATAFAAYLGYENVNRVAYHTVGADDAHVAVGYAVPGGRTATAGVIHLVRFGSGRNAPWEAVGTDDRTFTLDVPPYGATVSSPVRVGGTITGKDESIRVQIRALPGSGPYGTYCCARADGTNVPWLATVVLRAPSGQARPAVPAGQVLVIAASTGRRAAAAGRFAVTGVRAG